MVLIIGKKVVKEVEFFDYLDRVVCIFYGQKVDR